VLRRLLAGFGEDGDIQASADDLGDWHAFICNRVVPGSREALFGRQREEMGRIEPVAGQRLSPSPTYVEAFFLPAIPISRGDIFHTSPGRRTREPRLSGAAPRARRDSNPRPSVP
jgi:hypothetical protein